MGYAVYYQGEVKVTPALTEDHRSIVLAFSKNEHNEKTEPIFRTGAASAEPDLPWYGELFDVSEDGALILPDQDESRHGLRLSLALLIDHFLKPLGYVLDGDVNWDGKESDDRGCIFVRENWIEMIDDLILNPGPSWSLTRFADPKSTRTMRELLQSADNAGCTPDLTVVAAQRVEDLQESLPQLEDFTKQYLP